jgi:hypothetical protein
MVYRYIKNRDRKICASYRCNLLKVLKEGWLAGLKHKNKLELRNDDRHKRYNDLDQYQGGNNWLIIN